MGNLSRYVNVVLLFILVLLTCFVLIKKKYPAVIWYVQIIPGVLIACGITLNVAINALTYFEFSPIIASINPWLLYILIPFLIRENSINSEKLWRQFYLFMLIINILGILEYIFVFLGSYPLRVINTVYGEFYAGYFSIFHKLQDDTPHYRYYSGFLEPGTLAMYLLPAMIYALLHKRYIGLLIFCVAMYLTDSLGGIISSILIVVISPFILASGRSKNRKFFILVGSVCLALFAAVIMGSSLGSKYEHKGESTEIRLSQSTQIIDSWTILLLESPLGIKLETSTEDFEKNKLYVGSNFTPSIYLQFGGVIALIGYVGVLLVSFLFSMLLFLKNSLKIEERLVLSSIIVTLPFIVQRTTIWEHSLFALLFSTVLIGLLKSVSTAKRRVDH